MFSLQENQRTKGRTGSGWKQGGGMAKQCIHMQVNVKTIK
jgi:hypothetical protein